MNYSLGIKKDFMPKSWSYIRDEWLKSTSIPEEDAQWAIESLINTEEELFEIERKFKNNEDALEQVRSLKKKVKETISAKEISIDNISLNTSNSNKVQISVPSNLNYLLKVWAASEGRDLSSVAFQCLETGLREMKSKGSIPSIAIKRYNSACQKRIALAEVNNLLEKYEPTQNEFK
tara:strand:+ start:565 stop:1095 length:531 start_codon:yes stop_codon:yes gene_type:complete